MEREAGGGGGGGWKVSSFLIPALTAGGGGTGLALPCGPSTGTAIMADEEAG